MRKPRDYDAELKAIDDRAKALRLKRRDQLGELVLATGAGALTIDTLAGALLNAIAADAATKEAWQVSGAAFFRGEASNGAFPARRRGGRTSPADDRAQPSTALPSPS